MKTAKKKRGNKAETKTGHVNKFAEFSKADQAQANLEARKKQDAKIAEREEAERFGRRRTYW